LSANFAAGAAVSAAYAVELHAREHRYAEAAICYPRLEQEVQRLIAALRDLQEQQR
jgi:hypothetical protein